MSDVGTCADCLWICEIAFDVWCLLGFWSVSVVCIVVVMGIDVAQVLVRGHWHVLLILALPLMFWVGRY